MLGEPFHRGRPLGALQEAEGVSAGRERFQAPSAPLGSPRGQVGAERRPRGAD